MRKKVCFEERGTDGHQRERKAQKTGDRLITWVHTICHGGWQPALLAHAEKCTHAHMHACARTQIIAISQPLHCTAEQNLSCILSEIVFMRATMIRIYKLTEMPGGVLLPLSEPGHAYLKSNTGSTNSLAFTLTSAQSRRSVNTDFSQCIIIWNYLPQHTSLFYYVISESD